MSHLRLALQACFAMLFAAIAGCGDVPTGSTLSRLSPLGRAPLADLDAAATTTLANQGAAGLCLGMSGTGLGSLSSLQGCNGGTVQNWTVPTTGTTGTVRLSASGQCMDAFGGNSLPGDRIGLWGCSGNSNQQFTLTAAGELKVANGLCVGPQGGATASAALVLQTCSGAAAQKWTSGTASLAPVTTAPTARFTSQLTNSATGLCLTAGVSGAVTGLQSCASTGLQMWSVAGVNGAGSVSLIATGECLDAFGGQANVGDVVGLYSCHGGGNQSFTLMSSGELRVSTGFCVAPSREPAGSGTTMQLQLCTGAATQKWTTIATTAAPTTTAPTTTAPTTLPTSRFSGALASGAATGLCLTASSANAGVVTALQSCAASTLQTWSVPGAGSAGAVTSAANAGLCVDAFGGGMAPGDRIGLWGCSGANNQTITLTTAGELRISGYCVGPAGGMAVAGAGMQLQHCTGSSAQKWTTSGTTVSAPTVAPAPAPTPAAPGSTLATEPTLPTELAVPNDVPVTGRTWRPMDGAALREAAYQAQPGDEILLVPGAQYVGGIELTPKNGTGWITVRTDLPASEMPAPGVRVTPASAARFAKVLAPGKNVPAVLALNGARGWRFTAVEIAPHSDVSWMGSLVALGWGDATSMSQVPSDFIFDRVYAHGIPNKELDRCFLLNSARTAIVNSSVEECHSNFPFSTAIGGIAGPGPFRIENNSLSGGGAGLFFGGNDPRIQNLSPSDIVIRNNRVWRPMSWKGQWGAATLLEIKHARRVLIEGNLFENHWVATLTDFAVLIKSVNQDGGAPWSQATDITFRRNILRNSPAGVNLSARPEWAPAVPAARIKFEQNLFYNIGDFNGSTGGRMVQMTGPLSDVQLVNNTFLHNSVASHAIAVDGSESAPQASRIAVNNNIWTHGDWGWFGYWVGTRALEFFAGSSYQATGNVLIGAGSNTSRYTNASFAASLADMGFTNPSGGDFSLSFSSPFRSAGTGGSMPGVDMSALLSATSAARAMQ